MPRLRRLRHPERHCRDLREKGWAFEDIALISGIGCSSRIGGYMYCYGAHTTHGRSLPFAQGIKCANKDMHMIVCSGDGDSYAIGLGHFIHAMKRNMDITYLVFDNQVYGLTKGQTSPASSKGFVTKTTPDGNPETPLDTMSMAIGAGCTFVAQTFAIDGKQMMDIIEKRSITEDSRTSIFSHPACPSINSIPSSGTRNI